MTLIKSHILLSCYGSDQVDRTMFRATLPHENIEHGVFATRSPDRPNPVAFSVVDLTERDGDILRFGGLMQLTGRRLWISSLFLLDIDCMKNS